MFFRKKYMDWEEYSERVKQFNEFGFKQRVREENIRNLMAVS